MRDVFHEQLDAVVGDLVTMTKLVRAATESATQSLLSADIGLAEVVIAGDDAVDEMRQRIEDQAVEILARQQPVAGDLRTLVAALRMAGDLERGGDYAVHVAKLARLRYPESAVPAQLHANIFRMAALAADMLAAAAAVVETRNAEGALALEDQDDEMDMLRRTQFRLLLDVGRQHGTEAAVDVALLGRYYERIADHAVSLARRVFYLVTGEPFPRASV
jgi:phosphate transport system protein